MHYDYPALSILLNQEVEAITKLNTYTDLPSFLLEGFFSFMIVMTIYNFLLYRSLKYKIYLLYVSTIIFAILSTVSTNGLGEQLVGYLPYRKEES